MKHGVVTEPNPSRQPYIDLVFKNHSCPFSSLPINNQHQRSKRSNRAQADSGTPNLSNQINSELGHEKESNGPKNFIGSEILPHLRPQTLHPSDLARREIFITLISRIIHVVVNGIHPSVHRARILSRLLWTAVCAFALHRSIVDKIPLAFARVAFESMQQPQPVPRLVNRCAAFVVTLRLSAGHGAGVDVAAVGGVEAWVGSLGDFGGQGAGSKDAASEVRVEIEVQVFVRSSAESGFEVVHCRAVGDGPGVVGGEGGVDEVESDSYGVVSGVEGRGLGVGHLLGDGGGFGGAGYDVEVGVDCKGLLEGAAREGCRSAGSDGRGLLFGLKGANAALEVLRSLVVVHSAGMAAVDVGRLRVDKVCVIGRDFDGLIGDAGAG